MTDIQGFVEKWRGSAAAERANKDSFLNDLCAAIGVPAPDPTTGDAKRDHYVFEKSVQVSTETGRTTKFVDLYKRGCFVLEAKQGSESTTGKLGTAKRGTPTWNVAMNAAFGQAIGYATALEEPPPFILVTDIGHCFDLYASFDGTPRYRPFPNALEHRFYLTRLAERAETLRAVFLDPLSLDPSKAAVDITREVAGHLAELTKRLEKSGHDPQLVADFLMRCIFTMFAEDVGLLVGEIFTKGLRERWIDLPRVFAADIEALWRAMNEGAVFGFFGKLLHFNGGLFKSAAALPLEKADLEILLEAASCRWNRVEPAILGTLFEGALVKKERHSLGAHFTPRAYVERLVRPTIEDPIRRDWSATQAKVRDLASGNKIREAKAEVRVFMKRLSEVRVLDPACGSGNFLYVALDLMKAIEDEAFALLLALEGGQRDLCLDASEVTPKQFLGIEINPRAKAIADLVLWIGYLQWHYRTRHRGGRPREPVLEDYRNVACQDALLAYDNKEFAHDERTGKPSMRWDGETMKKHPVTGELVPDNRFSVPVYRFVGARKAAWPEADFIVGNPPFVGNKRMRAVLGDEYVEALRMAVPEVPESADYVMYWWNQAAALVRDGAVRQFGLITTNSIRQTYGQAVVAPFLKSEPPLSLVFAVPDHPWVDGRTAAAVRVAMTVGVRGRSAGVLVEVIHEGSTRSDDGLPTVSYRETTVTISEQLSTGTELPGARPLAANHGLAFRGVTLVGDGFIVDGNPNLAKSSIARKLVGARTLLGTGSSRTVLDLFGMSEDDAIAGHPKEYQHLRDTVRPLRLEQKRASYADVWWVFAEPRSAFRSASAGLTRYIATVETSRHRWFTFVDVDALPEQTLVAIASDSPELLGVLSSRLHTVWSAQLGSRLGVGNDLRYTIARCFDTFPFPERIAPAVGKVMVAIDSHRNRVRRVDSGVTMTGLYNVMQKLRAEEPLSPKDKVIHDQGLVSILKKLHDDLDNAVFEAYGWRRDLSDQEIVEHIGALNARRAAEEERDLVRWLRPEFQHALPIPDVEHAAAIRPGVAKGKPPLGPGIATTTRASTHRKKKKASP